MIIYCKAVCCKYLGPITGTGDFGECQKETIHLQPCSNVADNVMACSEFEEESEDKD